MNHEVKALPEALRRGRVAGERLVREAAELTDILQALEEDPHNPTLVERQLRTLARCEVLMRELRDQDEIEMRARGA